MYTTGWKQTDSTFRELMCNQSTEFLYSRQIN